MILGRSFLKFTYRLQNYKILSENVTFLLKYHEKIISFKHFPTYFLPKMMFTRATTSATDTSPS